MAKSFLSDLAAVPQDTIVWAMNPRWPSKLALLRSLQRAYPHVFASEEEVIVGMSQEKRSSQR